MHKNMFFGHPLFSDTPIFHRNNCFLASENIGLLRYSGFYSSSLYCTDLLLIYFFSESPNIPKVVANISGNIHLFHYVFKNVMTFYTRIKECYLKHNGGLFYFWFSILSSLDKFNNQIRRILC